jgi:hypothetical protein
MAEEENIEELKKKVQEMEDKEIENLANDILDENLEQNFDKVVSIFNFLDGTKIKKEHKIVSQLDEVTKDSELKASEIFDVMADVSSDLQKVSATYKTTEEFLVSLQDKVDENLQREITKHLKEIGKMKKIKEHSDAILLEGMSLMQYQDINRQRIERVINIIRTLSKYLNLLFEGDKRDIERTTTANFIEGDNVAAATNDDIDSLFAANSNIDDIIKELEKEDK